MRIHISADVKEKRTIVLLKPIVLATSIFKKLTVNCFSNIIVENAAKPIGSSNIIFRNAVKPMGVATFCGEDV